MTNQEMLAKRLELARKGGPAQINPGDRRIRSEEKTVQKRTRRAAEEADQARLDAAYLRRVKKAKSPFDLPDEPITPPGSEFEDLAMVVTPRLEVRGDD